MTSFVDKFLFFCFASHFFMDRLSAMNNMISKVKELYLNHRFLQPDGNFYTMNIIPCSHTFSAVYNARQGEFQMRCKDCGCILK